MEKESFLVLDSKSSQSRLFSDIEVYVIATEAFIKIPFKQLSLSVTGNAKLKTADLIQKKCGSQLVTPQSIVPYNIHSYELATVIGVQEKDLLLYGNKIGERIIKNYPSAQLQPNNAVFGIQRGDELLMLEYTRGEYAIIHNITQAKLKYAQIQKINKTL